MIFMPLLKSESWYICPLVKLVNLVKLAKIVKLVKNTQTS
jgi:hypothetical protein